MSEQAIRDAFDSAVADGKGADEVKVEMIKAGCQFKDTGRLYKEWAIETGIMVDAKERAAKVEDILSGFSALDNEDDFNSAMDAIMDGIPNTNNKQAGGLIRSYAKKNDMEVFKRAKAAGAGRTSFASKFYDSLRSNPGMTEDEAAAIINGTDGNEETSANVQKHASHYQAIRKLVNDVAA